MKRLVLVILLADCARQEPVEEFLARNAVRRYNEMLPQVYRTFRIELLDSVATPEEVHRVDALIMGMRERKKVLLADLKSMKVESIRFPGSITAEVVTREKWNYQHFEHETGKAGEEKRLEGRFQYRVEHKEGKWLVSRVEALP